MARVLLFWKNRANALSSSSQLFPHLVKCLAALKMIKMLLFVFLCWSYPAQEQQGIPGVSATLNLAVFIPLGQLPKNPVISKLMPQNRSILGKQLGKVEIPHPRLPGFQTLHLRCPEVSWCKYNVLLTTNHDHDVKRCSATAEAWSGRKL